MFLLALCGGGRPSASLPLLADVPASPRRGVSHPVHRRSQITNSNTIEGALAVRGQRLFVRPIESGDADGIRRFLEANEAPGDPPACGLLGKLVGDLVAV